MLYSLTAACFYIKINQLFGFNPKLLDGKKC